MNWSELANKYEKKNLKIVFFRHFETSAISENHQLEIQIHVLE